MGQVVHLGEVRARQAAAQVGQDLNDLYERIHSFSSSRRLSSGAVRVLLAIARDNHIGNTELSYNHLANCVGVSKQTVMRALCALEEHKLIRVRRSRVGKLAATNRIEIDFTGPLGDHMSHLKRPKNKELGSTKKVPPTQKTKNWVVPKVDGKDINNKENIFPKGNKRCALRYETAKEAIEQTTLRTEEKRKTKTARCGNQLTLAAVKASWTTAMRKHYPTVPPVLFSTKEFAIFKHKMQPIISTCSLAEFFDFLVTEWRHLRDTRFVWLRVQGKDISVSPSLPELMRYWKIFAQAFSDSRMAEADNLHKASRTTAQQAQDELAKAKAEAARVAAENSALKQRLAKAERLAYAPEPRTKKDTRTLTERRLAAEEEYGKDADIPDWE